MLINTESLNLFKTYLVMGNQANKRHAPLPKDIGALIVQYAQLNDRAQDVKEILDFLKGGGFNDDYVFKLKRTPAWGEQNLDESVAFLKKWDRYTLQGKYKVYSIHYRKLLSFLLNTPHLGEYGSTAWQRIVYHGAPSLIDAFMQNGADILYKNINGGTVLMFAARGGNLGLVKMICDRGVDLNEATTIHGMTALTCAATCGHAEVLSYLLKRGADVNKTLKTCGSTALHYAAFGHHHECIRILIRHHAQVDAIDYSGKTALFDAVRQNSRVSVEILLKNGADAAHVDNQGMRVVDYAAMVASTKIVTLLSDAIEENEVLGYAARLR